MPAPHRPLVALLAPLLLAVQVHGENGPAESGPAVGGAAAGADARFAVVWEGEPPRPAPGAKNVGTDEVVRVYFTRPIDPATLGADSFHLLDEKSDPVPALLQTDLTGGVATLSPTQNLKPAARYTARVTAALRSADGAPVEPFSWSFTTTKRKPEVRPEFVFSRHRIDDRDSNSAISVGPDGNLYVANTYGQIRRYRLHPKTGLATGSDVAYESKGDQIVSLLWDPDATADNLLLWISYARYDENYSGTISRLTLRPFGDGSEVGDGSKGSAAKHPVEKQDYIVGLPHDDLLHHQPNGIAFGPDGRLYQSVGGVATLGGSPNWKMEETPLSAAVIVADVRNPSFNGGRPPCDVRTSAPVSYDPSAADAPVKIYATGFRNAYDLHWVAGHLFTATNQNSISKGVKTPASPDGKVPAVTAMPREMLYRVLPGRYYGHPNPARKEYVLNGGNPTKGRDPYEVPEYPVGVKPEKAFDPGLVYDLRPGGGNSANGMDEYKADGPLKGRLLIAYFSGSKGIQTFAFDADGRVTSEHPLVDADGNVVRFKGAIDVAAHPTTGRIYVADFGDWKRPHHGLGGAVWMLEPAGAAGASRAKDGAEDR